MPLQPGGRPVVPLLRHGRRELVAALPHPHPRHFDRPRTFTFLAAPTLLRCAQFRSAFLSDDPTVAVGRMQGNPWNGTELQGWTVSKPIVHGNQTVLLPYTKVGTYLQGHDRNFVLASDNILSERDPEKIVWRTWPAGDGGATQGCG